MSSIKIVKKLCSINEKIIELNQSFNSVTNPWKTIFNSHAKNSTQSQFETHHEVISISGGTTTYNTDQDKGIRILAASPATVESGVGIKSCFRLPYVTQKIKICFNHEKTINNDTSIIQYISDFPTFDPTDDNLLTGCGFIWEPVNIFSIIINGVRTTLPNFNIDPLDGTGDSGINITDDVGVFSTFMIIDYYSVNCIKFGIKCNGKDIIFHEYKGDINVRGFADCFLYFTMADESGTLNGDQMGFFKGWEVMVDQNIDDCILDSRRPFITSRQDTVTASSSLNMMLLRYNDDGITPNPDALVVRNIYPDKLLVYGCGLFLIKIFFTKVTNGNQSTANSVVQPTNSHLQILTDTINTPIINDESVNIVTSNIHNNYINIDLHNILYWYHFAFTDIANHISTEIRIEVTNLNSTNETFNLEFLWREI